MFDEELENWRLVCRYDDTNQLKNLCRGDGSIRALSKGCDVDTSFLYFHHGKTYSYVGQTGRNTLHKRQSTHANKHKSGWIVSYYGPVDLWVAELRNHTTNERLSIENYYINKYRARYKLINDRRPQILSTILNQPSNTLEEFFGCLA